jgi:hypothetical protein
VLKHLCMFPQSAGIPYKTNHCQLHLTLSLFTYCFHATTLP